MKKIALAAAVLALGTVSASAADLAARPYTKAPPMVAAVYDWTGFYIGANGGWGSSRQLLECRFRRPLCIAPRAPMTRPAARSAARSRYRWQAGTWVFGLEAQGNWADFSVQQHEPGVPRPSQPTRTSMRSACSPVRSVMPSTTSCSTSRAALP